MNEAICNTSPLLYLYRIGAIDWLPKLFSGVWAPSAVAEELHEGRKRGYDVPNPVNYEWLGIVDPASMPSEWPAKCPSPVRSVLPVPAWAYRPCSS